MVVIGSAGFIGGAIADRLEHDGIPTVRVTRRELDLLSCDAGTALASLLRPGDAVVAAAALAPCKTAEMLCDNMTLALALVRGVARVPISHLINISSDAVYADEPVPLTETSATAPTSLHGVMHLAREIMLTSEVTVPLALLRPTLVYGAGDPHNGYGPNRFRRQAARGEPITLFGQGEERRDHVDVADLAELASRVVSHRSVGRLNVATGLVTSFKAVAEIAVRLSGRAVAIVERPRQGPMPHNGYRPFDIAACRAAFPDFCYRTLEAGMALAQKQDDPDG